jgi:alpha-beta hydrolase superfamily lysophospholipase
MNGFVGIQAPGNYTLTVSFTGTGAATNYSASASISIRVARLELVTDFDRNGIVDEDDRWHLNDPFSTSLWINDDRDSGDVVSATQAGGPSSDIPVPSFFLRNCDSSSVDGRRDLLDFFPVAIDIHWLEDQFGRPDFYRLRQADGAVNAVYTPLGHQQMGSYLTDDVAGCGPRMNRPLRSAETVQATAAGTELPPRFLARLRQSGGQGVFLIEGRAASDAPLVLEAVSNGAVVARAVVPLRIRPVEQMMVCVDGRDGAVSAAAGSALPSFYGKHVIFLHGFNVDSLMAYALHCEMFKRLRQSGSNARFHAVTWRGDTAGATVPALHYHDNVVNAFNAAPHLKNYVNSLDGEKTLMAHSLGNLVVASAISDHGMNVSKYFMFNAAVPAEAFDLSHWSEAETGNPLVNHTWAGYQRQTWAAKWYELFAAPDDRAKLTWRNRFPNIDPDILYNYYSSGDEVLGLSYELGAQSMIVVHSDTGKELANFSWQKQERFKGRGPFDLIAGLAATDAAGWGFNIEYFAITGAFVPFHTNVYTMAQANALSASQLMAAPAFLHSPAAMFTNSIPFTVRNELLANAIPALSGPVGSRSITLPDNNNQNRDINGYSTRTDWPRTISSTYGQSWLHGDLKDVAYFYMKSLFDEVVQKGELK